MIESKDNSDSSDNVKKNAFESHNDLGETY